VIARQGSYYAASSPTNPDAGVEDPAPAVTLFIVDPGMRL
jgi:hypothetical protein